MDRYSAERDLSLWVERLEIRDVFDRSVRHIDDEAS